MSHSIYKCINVNRSDLQNQGIVTVIGALNKDPKDTLYVLHHSAHVNNLYLL